MKVLKGFTLIELLVVISIIGLLSTVAVIGINNARGKARDGERKANLSQIKKALELYYNSNGQVYPESSDPGAFECTGSAVPAGLDAFVTPIPIDPLPDRTTLGTNCLQYRSDGVDYKMRVNLELDSETMTGDGGTSSVWYEVFTPGGQGY